MVIAHINCIMREIDDRDLLYYIKLLVILITRSLWEVFFFM